MPLPYTSSAGQRPSRCDKLAPRGLHEYNENMTHRAESAHSQHRLLTAAGLVLILGSYVAWLAWGSGDRFERFLIGSLSMLFTSLLAAVLAVWAQQTTSTPATRRAWLWLSLGLLLWAGNDLLRMLSGLSGMASAHTPHWINIASLLGTLALWLGLVLYPRQPREHTGQTVLLLDTSLSTAAGLTLMWIAAIQPVVAHLRGGGSPLTALNPLADLAGLLLLMNLFLMSETRRMPIPFGWISLGLAAYTLSDLAYSTLLLQDAYQTGSATDLGWVLGDACLALGALSQIRDRNDASSQPGLFRRRLRRAGQSYLPLVLTLILGLYTILAWQLFGTLNELGMWVTVVLSLGLIGRQGLLFGEIEFQKYASLVSSIAEPTFVCDRKGRLQLLNPALLEATGYRAAQLLGRPLDKLLPGQPGTSALLEKGLLDGWSGEVELGHADGSTLPVSLALRPLRPSSDSRLVVAGTAHDLSEQKAQQAALQAANEQITADRAELANLNTNLEQNVAEKTASLREAYSRLEAQNLALQELDRLKSDFVSMVSHELRAPLTNINAGIELSLVGPQPLPERTHQNLELVQAEIQRLTRFVETILDLSALDAGRLPLYPSPISLQTTVATLQQQMTHLEGAQRVHWDIPPNFPFLVADEQALNSVVFHLLDNAMKYAPEGAITVSAGTENGQARICVRDAGPGIDPEALPLLFERFTRLNSEDAQTVYGHGLGLYIARRLARGMDGEIRAENHPEGGACFTFWLPLAAEGSEEDEI